MSVIDFLGGFKGKIKLFSYVLFKKVLGIDFIVNQTLEHLSQSDDPQKSEYLQQIKLRFGEKFIHKAIISDFAKLKDSDYKNSIFYLIRKTLGTRYVNRKVTSSFFELEGDGKDEVFGWVSNSMGGRYLTDKVISRFDKLGGNYKDDVYSAIKSGLGEQYLYKRLASDLGRLEDDEYKEGIFYLIRKHFGVRYVNRKVITSFYELDGDAKDEVFDWVTNSLGNKYVNTKIISRFHHIRGDYLDAIFDKIITSIGNRYVYKFIISNLTNLSSKEQDVFFQMLFKFIGENDLYAKFLDKLPKQTKQKKSSLYSEFIQSIGLPFYKQKLLDDIALFEPRDRDRLYSAIRKIVGYEFIYHKVISNVEGNVSKTVVYDDLSQFLGVEFISEQALNNSLPKYLGSLPIEQQFLKYRHLLPDYANVFASQEGEDVLLKRIMKDMYNESGFYVDVGAHHPVRFSTTFHYYLKGWRGINIDPLPGMKALFDQLRPRDINLEYGVSQHDSYLTYYMFEEPAFNTFVDENYESASTKTNLIDKREVSTLPLKNILDESLPSGVEITFMNIDVEGFEYEVLTSSDWHKYRPKFLCIETLSTGNVGKVEQLLDSLSYIKVGQLKNSSIYVDQAIHKIIN